MRSVPWARARSAVVGAAAVALLLAGASGCDAGDDIGGEEDPAAASDAATDVPAVATVTTLQNVGKTLDGGTRDRLKASVTQVLDGFFDGAYLGEFPRDDYAAAFAGFTEGAARDAQRDLPLLSSAAIADQVDSATATRRRVRLDVFAVDGNPRGLTAHFVLEFDTEGQLEQSVRVRGDLYLAREKGEWKVFGYDVAQAERR